MKHGFFDSVTELDLFIVGNRVVIRVSTVSSDSDLSCTTRSLIGIKSYEFDVLEKRCSSPSTSAFKHFTQFHRSEEYA